MKPADEESPESGREPSLREMSALLKRWEMEPWPEIAEAARAAGPIMKDRLVTSRRWESLSASEQAAVHWAMTTGHVLANTTESRLDRDRDGARLRRISEAVRHVADLCDGWAHGKRARDAHHAEDIGHRMAALPEGWRGEAMRRVMDGEDPSSMFAEASMALNILRSVYGIDARTP